VEWDVHRAHSLATEESATLADRQTGG